jgi:chorismate mutase
MTDGVVDPVGRALSDTDPIGRALTDIDRLDAEIIRLWRERVALTVQLTRLRSSDGEPKYRHAEHVRVTTRYVQELNADGVALAHLLLRHLLR